eukprot:TRINITY_DN47339_c0_g1_i1.p1 TRINITY_DN47339_c0_g1~~TRINITY_DN47339_c0_g1_i1.p1  ORF type:complete len:481 (-),score=73.17 TRINITY_DN47339_c0_g1_i1:81-1481(-)
MADNHSVRCARCFENTPGANYFKLACGDNPANVTSALGGPRPWSSTTLSCRVAAEEVRTGNFQITLREESGAWWQALELRLCRQPDPLPTPINMAVCTQPLFKLHLHPRVLNDWLAYHRDVLQIEEIDVYDIDGSAAASNKPGVMYFGRFQEALGSSWLRQATEASSPYVTEVLAEMHCLYRHRALGTKWVSYLHSPDEFLTSRTLQDRAASAPLYWDLLSDVGRLSWIALSARNFGGPDAGSDHPAVSRFTSYNPHTSDSGSFMPLVKPANVLSLHVHWARARRPELLTWLTDPETLRVNHYLDLFAARQGSGGDFSREDGTLLWASPRLHTAMPRSSPQVTAALAAWAGREVSEQAIEQYDTMRRDALRHAFTFIAAGQVSIGHEAFMTAFHAETTLDLRILHTHSIRLESAGRALDTFMRIDRDGNGHVDESEFVDGLVTFALETEGRALMNALKVMLPALSD